MSLLARAHGCSTPQSAACAPLWLLVTLCLGGLSSGCQKDDHPPYATGCVSNCEPLAGVSLGGGTPPSTGPSTGTDAGTGRLTGEVFSFTDDGFVKAVLFSKTATVNAIGNSTATVSGPWDGVDPYSLSDVASLSPNWVSVQPDDSQGDALLTYQAVDTSVGSAADLDVVSGEVLDAIITDGQAQRLPGFGQVVLFLRSQSTGDALSGLHVAMASAGAAIYASASGWVLDPGNALTGATGLVVFANVATTSSTDGTQLVSVGRPATATAAAVDGGTFAVKVVADAVTLANVGLQL